MKIILWIKLICLMKSRILFPIGFGKSQYDVLTHINAILPFMTW